MWLPNVKHVPGRQRFLARTDSQQRLFKTSLTRQPNDDADQQRQKSAVPGPEASSSVLTCGGYFRQYLLNSTLHGLRYVGDVHITVFERIFFMCSFLLVVILSVYFISNIYQKWSASPVIIGLSATATSIGEFPFPAVTICNMNQARRTVVENFTAESRQLLQSLCHDDGDRSEERAAGASDETVTNASGNWDVFRQLLLDVSQPCSAMLLHCKYATRVAQCMELFNTVLTDDGLCCSFNSVHPMYLVKDYDASEEFDSVNNTGDLTASDWTPEDGWPGPVDRSSVYPRPAAGSGSHMGLIVVLNASLSDYYCSSTNSKGFKVLLHNPTETPKITDYGFSMTTGRETRVVINPRISVASRAIKSVPEMQRQCVFANEVNLSYFRTYSRKNCEMECESRIIEQFCGCVQYHMPRTQPNTQICGRKEAPCYERVALAIGLGLNATFACQCLPGCFEIYYKPSMYTSSLGTGEFRMRNEFMNRVPRAELNTSMAVLYIYYEESIFRSYTKEELIGFTEFLSSTGGLLGLFMGFSVVSLIEIIYFVSLRPCCAYWKTNVVKSAGAAAAASGGARNAVRPWYIGGDGDDDVTALASQREHNAVPDVTVFSFAQRWRDAADWFGKWNQKRKEMASGNSSSAAAPANANGPVEKRFPYTE